MVSPDMNLIPLRPSLFRNLVLLFYSGPYRYALNDVNEPM
jgi:hypothetical protein